MKTTTKLGIGISMLIAAAIIAFFVIPIKQWKKYKETHPSLFEVKDKATPTYWKFCLSYWKTFGAMNTEKEEDITYDGGELEEIVVTPN